MIKRAEIRIDQALWMNPDMFQIIYGKHIEDLEQEIYRWRDLLDTLNDTY